MPLQAGPCGGLDTLLGINASQGMHNRPEAMPVDAPTEITYREERNKRINSTRDKKGSIWHADRK